MIVKLLHFRLETFQMYFPNNFKTMQCPINFNSGLCSEYPSTVLPI